MEMCGKVETHFLEDSKKSITLKLTIAAWYKNSSLGNSYQHFKL